MQWCAVDGDACGRKSDDLHVGSQDDQYGWSHWDFCDPSKKGGWTHKVLWKAKHSAGQVTCLAEFLITSDKATEWRALDLLQQQVVDKTDGRQAPAQIASVYEQCVRNAQDSASVVFCETDMLAHFPQSLVRHALLISRANSIRVHWANREFPLSILAPFNAMSTLF